ncbi:MAG: hypothetical protein H7246_18280 [Phycisphaerae bacterium]|nr:hypothetical protein [Saprospiraceae bacterium]
MNRLLIALFLLATVFSACKKDGDKDSTFFRFKVNGTDYEATGLLAYGTYFSNYFVIYGIKDQNSNETCYISLPEGITVGTHALDDNDHSAYYIDAADVAYSTFWGTSSGSVTIEEIDASHVKGTFQFTAYDSGTETIKKTITEGEFNVAFR